MAVERGNRQARCQGCFGADVAGPVATQVIDSLLNSGG